MKNRADEVLKNRFPDICSKCGAEVKAFHGRLNKKAGKWIVTHLNDCVADWIENNSSNTKRKLKKNKPAKIKSQPNTDVSATAEHSEANFVTFKTPNGIVGTRGRLFVKPYSGSDPPWD